MRNRSEVRRHNLIVRMVAAVAGTVLLCVGIALLVLPGPGLLMVLAGLLVLARAFPAVERFIEPVRKRAMQAAEESVSSVPRILLSVLAGIGLIGAGIVWGVLPKLPFGGWTTGSSLILSGVVLLALLVYSYRRTHRQEPSVTR